MKEKKGRTGNCHKLIIMLKAGPTDTPLNNNNNIFFGVDFFCHTLMDGNNFFKNKSVLKTAKQLKCGD